MSDPTNVLDPIPGPPGPAGQDGAPGRDGADGAPGRDGASPVATVLLTAAALLALYLLIEWRRARQEGAR